MVSKISFLLLTALLSLAAPQSFAAANKAAPMQLQPMNSYYYSFGQWPVGYTTYADFTFTSNWGTTQIYGIYTFGGGSFQSTDNCPVYLYAGYSCNIRIYFMPYYTGFQNGQTTISTDAGTSQIFVDGYGY